MNQKVERASAWLYGGLWRILVDWFVVPEDAPDLPVRSGENLTRFRPASGFVRYLKLWFWLGLTTIDVLLLIAWLSSFFVSVWLGVVLAPVFVAVAIVPDLIAYVGIHLRYNTTWYVMSNRSLRIRRGIWVIRETTITFENIQDVKVHQGPVQRYFGISDVIVETAGGGGKSKQEGGGPSPSHVGLLEGVADAGHIRDVIMARVRHSRHTGLGDEDSHLLHPDAAGVSAWTPEHVAALRNIRHAVSTLRNTLAV